MTNDNRAGWEWTACPLRICVVLGVGSASAVERRRSAPDEASCRSGICFKRSPSSAPSRRTGVGRAMIERR